MCFITLFQLQSCGSWTSQAAKPSEARAMMLALMAEREQFRTLSRAKVQKNNSKNYIWGGF
jgi:hypothetical protein